MLLPLTSEDLDAILSWRNQPDVRRCMFSSHVISADEHQAWFEALQDESSRQVFVYLLEGKKVGVVQFTEINQKNGTAFWGFYLGPYTPVDASLRLELAATTHAFENMKLHKLSCEVIEFNRKVLNMHKKCGFRIEGEFLDHHWDGAQFQSVFRLAMLRREWDQNKSRIESRLRSLSPT